VITEVDMTIVTAARDGDQRALDRLVAEYLPLVYNIVGRALGGTADVDDVVQESMLRVVRGLPRLRDPASFRSWLVAVAMNQVRDHHRARAAQNLALDTVEHVEDPGADFADLTVTRLGLTGQRQEIAEATRWLETDDRELLSLWWLVETGHLTRAELVAALDLDPHHVTVRLARMKTQLEAARRVVRALTSTPRCPGLAHTASSWPGRPLALWRKRFARHIRECRYCLRTSDDLIPPERLLVNLTLVPLPAGLAAATATLAAHSAAHSAARSAAPSAPQNAHRSATRSTTGPIRRHRAFRLHIGGHSVHWATGAAIAVTVGAAATVAVAATSGGGTAGSTKTAAHAPVTARPTPSTSPSLSPALAPAPVPRTPHPKPTARHSRKPTTPPTHSPSPTTGTSVPDNVLAFINQARAAQGLPPLTLLAGLNTSATRHSQTMAGGCGLSHQCPGEPDFGTRERQAGVNWTSAGENIGSGGPSGSGTAAITTWAINLTKSMLAEQPPNDGHRKNLLSTAFHHIGISVLRDASGTVWMTQDFAD
jgi:RNA polymerase sigma factor (sigma-70 family)